MSSIGNFVVCKHCVVAELYGLSQTVIECPRVMVVVVVTVFTAGAHRVTVPGSQTPVQMGQITITANANRTEALKAFFASAFTGLSA